MVGWKVHTEALILTSISGGGGGYENGLQDQTSSNKETDHAPHNVKTVLQPLKQGGYYIHHLL